MTSTRFHADFDSPPVPRLVRQLLGQVDRRLRADRVLRGLGMATLVAALGAAVGMAVDLAWPVPVAVRWGIWVGWLATVGLVLAFRVVGPLVRRVDPLDLAAIAERGEPKLGERLTATVGLLGRPGRLNGSPVLVAALAGNASAYAGLVDAAAVVPFRAALRWVVCGGLALALVVAPSLIWPDPFRDLGQRFLAPWANLDRVGWLVMDVRPGDATSALGADFLVSVRVEPRLERFPAPTNAWLEWTDEEGNTRRVAMPELESSNSQLRTHVSSLDRAFAVTLPRLAGSLRYRVGCGGAVSRSFRVKAIAPPSVVSVEAKIEPPPYTGIPSASARDPDRIEAWEGSRVILGVMASRPVVAVTVDWPQRPKPVPAALGADRTKAEATLVAEASGPFALSLRDEQGLVSTVAIPRRLVVRADAPPQVSVRGAEARAEARADDRLRLEVAALDDVAVASVELHYAVVRPHAGTEAGEEKKGAASESSGHLAASVSRLGTRSVRGEAVLALGPLGLKPGDTVSYRVRVADNRPAPRGPNVVWSPVGTLAIVAAAEPLLARRDRAEREAIQAKLDALKVAAAENRKETEQLRYAADAVQRDNGQWDRTHQLALTQREAKARELGDRLQLLARELATHSRFQLLARPARQIADGEAESSRALLGQARDATDPARRFDDLRQADLRLAGVSTRLDDLQRRFDALVQTEADRQQLQNLAEREETLAGQVPGPEAADPAQLDRLRADQAQVQQDLDSLQKDSPNLRAEDLDRARETMRQAARQLDAARRPDPGRDAVQAAKQALDQAAQDLNAAARQVAGRQGREEGEGQAEHDGEGPGDEPGPGAPKSGDPRGALATPGTLDLNELKGLIRSQTGRAWGELPGHLRTEILQMSQSRYRDEYARLIQLYFQEIATGDSPRP